MFLGLQKIFRTQRKCYGWWWRIEKIIFNDFFGNVVNNLRIKESRYRCKFSDPIDFAIMKFKNHSSINMINVNISSKLRFRCENVSENNT